MNRRAFLATSLLALAAKSAPNAVAGIFPEGIPTDKALGNLKPGEYYWKPELSPNGPLLIIVSIPAQTLNAYRNGIRIARSSASTAARGRRTPTGVFTILEKQRKHTSSIYNSPMPNMQRLTWSGIAMHAGNLPGYPASHGCIRLPEAFSRLLFSITKVGTTVVIADDRTPQPQFASYPGMLLAPKDFSPEMLKPLAPGDYQWQPQRSTGGPVSILASAADETVYVYRNGEPIGRAALEILNPGKPLGGHVFTLLNGVTGIRSLWIPAREAHRWMAVKTDSAGDSVDFQALANRVRVHPEFAAKVYDILVPGASIILTDAPATRRSQSDRDFVIIANDAPARSKAAPKS